ncbi:MAG: hypothetical protein ACP5G0_07050 [Desulfomonilia bacterium]
MTKRGVDKTQEEILEEMAKALGHTGNLLESVLEELAALDAQIQATSETDAYNILVEKFNTLRREALFRKEMLMIHREALGFTKHRYLDKMYPIPVKKEKL